MEIRGAEEEGNRQISLAGGLIFTLELAIKRLHGWPATTVVHSDCQSREAATEFVFVFQLLNSIEPVAQQTDVTV